MLFVDEPTTGLDVDSALDVVTFLASLKTTVVSTIHQPSNVVNMTISKKLISYEIEFVCKSLLVFVKESSSKSISVGIWVRERYIERKKVR